MSNGRPSCKSLLLTCHPFQSNHNRKDYSALILLNCIESIIKVYFYSRLTNIHLLRKFHIDFSFYNLKYCPAEKVSLHWFCFLNHRGKYSIWVPATIYPLLCHIHLLWYWFLGQIALPSDGYDSFGFSAQRQLRGLSCQELLCITTLILSKIVDWSHWLIPPILLLWF